ncbi:MAG TPA: carboxypeptidase-like regulatory domain-containing protein [Bryobacteraceae bacterium]|nr:carboxypeptidase-like regulatory domain-containing protein [Bryobacteraceae bacterium]
MRLAFLKLLTAIVAVAALSVGPLAAQGKRDGKENITTRSVQGVVTDGQDNPLENAVVQLKDTRSLQIRSFITRNNGTYHFHGLSKDIDYELKADHQGKSSDPRRLSSFDSRPQAVMNLKVSK